MGKHPKRISSNQNQRTISIFAKFGDEIFSCHPAEVQSVLKELRRKSTKRNVPPWGESSQSRSISAYDPSFDAGDDPMPCSQLSSVILRLRVLQRP
mmetsp:Transcript_30455/g.50271  ORF Transcript_30455/g.50271 Transcript_30455/m.50271 type:complete len:96 (-) Transcript_30455:107-394(-)